MTNGLSAVEAAQGRIKQKQKERVQTLRDWVANSHVGTEKCTSCNGGGERIFSNCEACNGSGKAPQFICPKCSGDGKGFFFNCGLCGGDELVDWDKIKRYFKVK